MSIESPIAPEIIGDEFATALTELAALPDVHTILESGSAEGTGSTAALVKGILPQGYNEWVDELIFDKLPPKSLHCIEISNTRFDKLLDRYKHLPFFHAYKGSSVALKDFMTVGQIRSFHAEHKTSLNKYPLPQVLEWLTEDLRAAALAKQGVIKHIKSLYNITAFDLVLLDGSAFTGWAELMAVMGSKYIALDDIVDVKHFRSFNYLSEHDDYELLANNPLLRNGYAIFRRTT